MCGEMLRIFQEFTVSKLEILFFYFYEIGNKTILLVNILYYIQAY